MSSAGYLIVDMQRVLAECEHGKRAADSLRGMLERTRPRLEELRERAERAAGTAQERAALRELAEFEARRRRELDTRSEALRNALVGVATGVLEKLAAERGVTLVLERGGVLVSDPAADVTEEAIRRVNAVRINRPPAK